MTWLVVFVAAVTTAVLLVGNGSASKREAPRCIGAASSIDAAKFAGRFMERAPVAGPVPKGCVHR